MLVMYNVIEMFILPYSNQIGIALVTYALYSHYRYRIKIAKQRAHLLRCSIMYMMNNNLEEEKILDNQNNIEIKDIDGKKITEPGLVSSKKWTELKRMTMNS